MLFLHRTLQALEKFRHGPSAQLMSVLFGESELSPPMQYSEEGTRQYDCISLKHYFMHFSLNNFPLSARFYVFKCKLGRVAERGCAVCVASEGSGYNTRPPGHWQDNNRCRNY